MRKKPWLLLCALLVSACDVVIPDVEVCSGKAPLSQGANCATTISGQTREIDLNAYLDMLAPNIEQNRGGAICMSTVDYSRQQTALEQACRALGKRCKKEVREAIVKMADPNLGD